MRTTEAECLDALQEAEEILGESPTKQQYENLKLTPAHSTILRVMGSWNEAKEAAGLETIYRGERGGSTVAPQPKRVALPNDLEWEELSGYQRWYYKNRDSEIAKKDERRAKLRVWLHGYKLEQCQCERCGEEDPPCLDFHHVGEKQMSISQMVVYGYSEDSILAEIEQCIVLCANCHRREHYNDPTDGPSQH